MQATEYRCPECQGWGSAPGYNWYTRRRQEFVCGICHGTGVVSLEVAISRLLRNAGLDPAALVYEVEQAQP